MPPEFVLKLFLRLAFIICAFSAVVLLVQCFIPAVRRFYVEISATTLRLLRVKPERIARLAGLMDRCTAWLHFVWGLCLYPLCHVLYMATFCSPDAVFHGAALIPPGFILSCALMLITFVIAMLWALIRGVQLWNQH